jgi:hypothetical protein
MKKRKTFDAVAFMRKRREELSRAYAGLSAEQIKERIHETLKNNPLWKKRPEEQWHDRKKTRPVAKHNPRNRQRREPYELDPIINWQSSVINSRGRRDAEKIILHPSSIINAKALQT